MASYEEERVKQTNTQLNRLKSATNNNTETTLRITNKNFQDEEFPQELILTTRQAAKTKNVFANNISTTKKHSEAQISKIIQPGLAFDSR